MKSQLRRTLCAPDHLDVVEGCGAESLAERFERSLFGGETNRQAGGRVARALRVGLLGFGEEAMRDVRSPRQALS